MSRRHDEDSTHETARHGFTRPAAVLPDKRLIRRQWRVPPWCFFRHLRVAEPVLVDPGQPCLNQKRVFGLVRMASLPLQPCTG